MLRWASYMQMLPLLILLLSLVMGVVFPVPSLRKPPKIPVSKKAFYAEYIQSKEWRAKRKQRIKFDGGSCRGFHWLPKKSNLQVHHKTYKRLGDESVRFDLITLCDKHHKRVHK